MMRVMLLILLISANCKKMNCDEEYITTETVSEVTEKKELSSADPEILENNSENKETAIEPNKSREDGEEIRVFRSSSKESSRNKAQFDNSTEEHSTIMSVIQKSTQEMLVDEKVDRDIKQEEKDPKIVETLKNDTIVIEDVEKQFEKLPGTSRAAAEIEDSQAMDLLEASAESKLSSNEMASSKVDETDRNSGTVEINEKSNESSGLDEGVYTRRMLSSPHYIVTVIDTNTQADTISTEIEPEVKIALNKNLNTYNTFNEFGTKSNTKINRSPQFQSNLKFMTSTPPVITKLGTEEVLNQHFLPKWYPRAELALNFPDINSDFQGPRDLPIYLRVKQDELHSRIPFIEAHYSLSKFPEDNTYFNSKNRQEYLSQGLIETQRSSTNNQIKNSRADLRNKVPQFYQNPMPIHHENFVDNKQQAHLSQDSRNQFPPFYFNQDTINSYFKRFENFNNEPRNKVHELVNPKMSLNTNEERNLFSTFRQARDKQFGIEHFVNSNAYMPSPSPRQIDLLNVPIRYDDAITKRNRILLQKLANASINPRKITTTLHGTKNMQNYRYFLNPNYTADSPNQNNYPLVFNLKYKDNSLNHKQNNPFFADPKYKADSNSYDLTRSYMSGFHI